MPKQKTNSSAKKRFRARANGFKRKCAYLRHILTKKAQKNKRNLRKKTDVCAADESNVARMLNHK